MMCRIIPTWFGWRLLAAVAVLLVSSCGMDAELEKVYRDIEEAKLNRAFENRLLPPWLPSGSVDIRVFSNLDLDDVWVRFKVSSVDATHLSDELEPLLLGDLKGTRLGRPLGLDWWAECLTLANVGDCGQRFEFYSAAGFSLALDRKAGEGYAWRR